MLYQQKELFLLKLQVLFSLAQQVKFSASGKEMNELTRARGQRKYQLKEMIVLASRE